MANCSDVGQFFPSWPLAETILMINFAAATRRLEELSMRSDEILPISLQVVWFGSDATVDEGHQ